MLVMLFSEVELKIASNQALKRFFRIFEVHSGNLLLLQMRTGKVSFDLDRDSSLSRQTRFTMVPGKLDRVIRHP